jgi:hypothetical protein
VKGLAPKSAFGLRRGVLWFSLNTGPEAFRVLVVFRDRGQGQGPGKVHPENEAGRRLKGSQKGVFT